MSSMFSARRDGTQNILHKIPSKYSGKEQGCYTLGQLHLKSVGPQMTYIDALILSLTGKSLLGDKIPLIVGFVNCFFLYIFHLAARQQAAWQIHHWQS